MSGSPVTEFVSEQALRMASSEGYSSNIDEFLAYSLELVPVFLEIGALVREQQQTSVLADITLASTCRDQPFKILHHLQNMLQSVQAHSTSKPSDIATVTEQDEYMRVNETYHLAAMLQIYQRVLRLPSSSDEIQEIVHRILTILPEITLRNSPCPGTVLLFPLFCAGCGAEEKDDRLKVRSILSKMSELYRLDAVKSCMRILDDVWSGGSLHKVSSSNLGWEKLVEGTTDIILY
ncbi:hypothetical protein UA08_05320 [Talaromyces atroroseus]|uniref:Uncharacterized protein n=1 Tax=Talaromyces atroroseus TaxID=1441469 RepID=A0A225AFR5_TALAT|nr:hypothetical protein UA08_05320 [Talaromyces atroroseus]OKL59460.1 hypothetical protein UA08_05320 [Talaromyces atroroseus]